MKYDAISIQNSSLDAYKLILDDTKCVGWVLSVVVTCWNMCLTDMDANVRYMSDIQVVEPALESY